jgi:hypothetical protein
MPIMKKIQGDTGMPGGMAGGMPDLAGMAGGMPDLAGMAAGMPDLAGMAADMAGMPTANDLD